MNRTGFNGHRRKVMAYKKMVTVRSNLFQKDRHGAMETTGRRGAKTPSTGTGAVPVAKVPKEPDSLVNQNVIL